MMLLRGFLLWPRGRLFWKFFFFFWAAQLLTSIGVGVTIWAHRMEQASVSPDGVERPPPPWGGAPGEFRFPPPPAESERPPIGRPPYVHPWRPPLMPILAGGLVSLIFAALLAGNFARPIRSLRQAFNDLAEGDLSTRIGEGWGGARMS